MTTELLAAAAQIQVEEYFDGDKTLGEQFAYICMVNDDLRRRCERLRKENDEYRQLIIEMRKKVAEVMHASMDDFK